MTDLGSSLKLDGTPRKPPLKPGETEWTEERVETLKTMWAAGRAMADIMRALGLDSRGAVSGKIARLGLALREPPQPPKPQQTRAQRRRAASYHFKRAGEELACEPIPPMDDVPPERRVKLVDLLFGTCRFFCGETSAPDGGFCPEKAVDGISWCAAHARIVFQPPRSVLRPQAFR